MRILCVNYLDMTSRTGQDRTGPMHADIFDILCHCVRLHLYFYLPVKLLHCYNAEKFKYKTSFKWICVCACVCVRYCIWNATKNHKEIQSSKSKMIMKERAKQSHKQFWLIASMITVTVDLIPTKNAISFMSPGLVIHRPKYINM